MAVGTRVGGTGVGVRSLSSAVIGSGGRDLRSIRVGIGGDGLWGPQMGDFAVFDGRYQVKKTSIACMNPTEDEIAGGSTTHGEEGVSELREVRGKGGQVSPHRRDGRSHSPAGEATGGRVNYV